MDHAVQALHLVEVICCPDAEFHHRRSR
jgi:hypothetical protein